MSSSLPGGSNGAATHTSSTPSTTHGHRSDGASRAGDSGGLDPQSAAPDASGERLGVPQLTALVVGSMVGAGIFSLPMNMAETAAPGPLLIGWAITGVGMLALALTFTLLANHASNPDGGVYGYARDGFGRFLGFSSAWGYWISAWLGDLSYLIVIFSTLGLWFPVFGEGTTLPAIGAASALLWVYTVLLLRGVRTAAGLNVVVTIAKIVPLVAFIVLTVIAFDMGVFTADFWGRQTTGLPVMEQVRGMMLVTVWVFLGIEGATVYSERARDRRSIGRATVAGFVAVLALLVAVNLLSAGILSQAELQELQDPSMAGVLQEAVGTWGAVLISIGLLVSVAGALLAWMLLCAEILSVTARDGSMPRILAKENRHGTPTWSVLLNTVVLQVGLVWAYFAGSSYYDLILMAGSMILLPYLLSAGYGVMLAVRNRRLGQATRGGLLLSVVATVYALWLIYAGGLDYLLMTALFYAPGLAVYAWARREQGKPVLTGWEWLVWVVMAVGFVAAVLGFREGWLAL